jgi:hypothetical protein
MNTFNVSVKGKPVLTEIPAEKLEGQLKIVKGIVWATGGSNDDIQIVENKL